MTKATTEAEVLLVVRVRLAGKIESVDRAKRMAKQVVASGRLPTEEAAEAGGKGVELLGVEGLSVNFATLYETQIEEMTPPEGKAGAVRLGVEAER